MMRLLFILLILLYSQESWAAIAVVAHGCNSGTSSTTASVTGLNTTGATFFIVSEQYFTGGGSVDTPTDTGSNTWTGATNWQNTVNGNAQGTRFYYVANPTTNASHTFTVTSGNSTFPSLCVAAFSGTLTSVPIDAENGSGNGSSVTSIATGSVLPVQNSELLVTSCQIKASSGVVTIDSGFTIADTSYNSTNSGNSIAYLVQTSASSVNPTWSFPSNSVGTNIATFKAQTPSSTTPSTTVINNATIHNATIN